MRLRLESVLGGGEARLTDSEKEKRSFPGSGEGVPRCAVANH